MMRATIQMWLLLGAKIFLSLGEDMIFHSPVHQCIPPLLFDLLVPTIFITPSVFICSVRCHKTLCHFYTYSEEKQECKIYGEGMSQKTFNSTYIDTREAAPPPGGPLEQIASGKNVKSIDIANGPWMAVDKNLSTYYESLTSYAWWMVDLETYHFIHKVEVYSRSDYFAYRFSDAEFRIGPIFRGDGILTSWPLIGFYKGPYPYGQPRLTYNSTQGICGRYVSVQRANSTTEAFSITEVEVYRRKP